MSSLSALANRFFTNRQSNPAWWPKPRPLSPTVDRLSEAEVLNHGRAISWLVTIVICLLAFGLHIVNLAEPNKLVFDETYYAKDAWTLSNLGYEAEWPKDVNDKVAAGEVNLYHDKPAFIVHPPLGKWLIAGGEWLFGMNSFGWRFASCVFGSILIGATIRLARRLSRSTLIGGLAGLFLTVDGLTFVMSRIALLDIFQATFAVMAVACVVADRDWFRLKLADYLRKNELADLGGGFGPKFLWRPWRLLAGVLFGCSIACKWNSLYLLAAFGIMSVVLDVYARRTAGASRKAFYSVLIEAPLAFCYLVVTAVAVYISTWWSYLSGRGGWRSDFAASNPDDFWVRTFGANFGSLMYYHREIYNFHTGSWIAEQTHTYEANPALWPIMGRVIGIDAVNDIKPGVDGCPATGDGTCLRVICGIGTPLLWWFACAACIFALFLWIFGRDQRFAFPLISALTIWLMWFPNADRPLFFFYAIMIIPFTATVLAMVLGLYIGPPDSPKRFRRSWIVAGIVILIIANFWFFYPILTDQLMTRTAWSWRMWFDSWI